MPGYDLVSERPKVDLKTACGCVVRNQIRSYLYIKTITESVKNACAIRGFSKISRKEMRGLASNTSK